MRDPVSVSVSEGLGLDDETAYRWSVERARQIERMAVIVGVLLCLVSFMVLMHYYTNVLPVRMAEMGYCWSRLPSSEGRTWWPCPGTPGTPGAVGH